MKTIALLTDFGQKDNYVGVMKGVILSINPNLNIVDISHGIVSHDIFEAGFILLKSFAYFPKGTVFLSIVDPGVGSRRRPIAIKTKNYYFVGPDNGSLSMAAEKDGVKQIVELQNSKYFLKSVSATFHGRDIFSAAAAHLSRGVLISKMGKSITKIKSVKLVGAKIKDNSVDADIVYIDKFGNLVTNLKRSILSGKKFKAELNGKRIEKLYSCYSKAKNNEPFFIEGSFSFLEISLKGRSAQEYFSVKKEKENKLSIEIGG